VEDTPKDLDVLDIPYQVRPLASALPFPCYKRQTTFLQTFGIPLGVLTRNVTVMLLIVLDEIWYFGPNLLSFFG
jgi:hypothetical protein